MRNLVYFMHSSLDGFVAGSNGEMNWITVDDEIFDFVPTMTDQVDTALYNMPVSVGFQAYRPAFCFVMADTDAIRHVSYPRLLTAI